MTALLKKPNRHFLDMTPNDYYKNLFATDDELRRQQRQQRLRLRAKCSAWSINRILDTMRPAAIGTLSGVAIPIEVWGRPSPLINEIIGVNALDSMLASNGEVQFLVDHAKDLTLARRSDTSLRLTRTTAGLKIEGDIPATDAGEAITQRIEAGEVAGFSFDILSDSETLIDGSARYVKVLHFSEISLVFMPSTTAYPLTSEITWQRK
jgi:HK97 family phage prohead protease